MAKVVWKPGTMLYPVPAVLISSRNKNGFNNLMTVAWAGTICSEPPMLSVSIRKERFSYNIIKESGEFVVNLTTKKLAYATDFCGVKSGCDIDKFKELGLTALSAAKVNAPLLAESPVNIECKVKDIIPLGSHDLFLAEVAAVNVDEALIDEDDKLHLEKADLIVYSHGQYYDLKEALGHFGYSVRKKPVTKQSSKHNK